MELSRLWACMHDIVLQFDYRGSFGLTEKEFPCISWSSYGYWVTKWMARMRRENGRKGDIDDRCLPYLVTTDRGEIVIALLAVSCLIYCKYHFDLKL